MSAQPTLVDFRLLGSPALRVDGAPVRPLRTRKGYALLALLADAGGAPVERDALTARLWPDSPGDAAAASLRRALTDLRNALGPAADRLAGDDRRALRLALRPGDRCDLMDFDAAAQLWRRSRDRDAARALVALAGDGAFGEGGAAREAVLLDALDALAADALATDSAQALALARSAVRRAPLSDPVQRRLYEAHAAVGDLPGALRAWRDFRVRLQAEGGLAPDPATVRLVARLRAAPTAATAPVPRFLGELVGRGDERARLTRLLERERLVTLVGPGGVGKTRLGAAVAAGRDAVWVDLTPLPRLADPASLWSALAGALGVPESAPSPLRAAVAAALRAHPRLIVLDNAEHVAPAAAALAAATLADAPEARVLATSRTALAVAGEAVVALDPLPDADACALFVRRAEAAGATLGDGDRAAVETICRLVDGLPLAVEFAAARARLLPLPRIAAELSRSRHSLRGASGTANPRQRTLDETLAWSVALLDEDERALFAALSLFPDGATIDAAEAVHGAPCASSVARLVEHSLLQRAGERVRFLATTRDFAARSLAARADADAVRSRFVAWARARAARIDEGIWSSESRLWAQRYAAEAAGLHAAVALASGPDALAIAARLGQTWWRQRLWRDGRECLLTALARPGADPDSHDGAEARWLAALFGWRLGAVGAAALEDALSAMLALRERDGSHETLTYLWHSAGTCRLEWGDTAGAVDAFARALAHSRATDDGFLHAYALNGVAAGARAVGDPDTAVAAGEAAAAHFAARGNAVLEADTRNQVGLARLARGEGDAARETLAAALALARERGADDVAADALFGLGEVALAVGALDDAEAHFSEAALQARVHDEPRSLARADDGLARVAAHRNVGV